jgi:hypothetical protein
MDMKAQAQILKDSGFEETVRAVELSSSVLNKLKGEIARLNPPRTEFAVPALGSLAQGLLAVNSDIEFITSVRSSKDIGIVDAWTHRISSSLRKMGFPVQEGMAGKDASNRPFEGLEGHCQWCREFARTDTSKPRLKAIYKANLVPILFFAHPIYETEVGLALRQTKEIWNYWENTKKGEVLPYFYNLLILEYYTLDRESDLKRLKFERDRTVRSIIILHLALFESRCIGEFRTPPLLARDIWEKLPDNLSKTFRNACIQWFDDYFKLRAAITGGIKQAASFNKIVSEFQASQQIIRDISYEWAKRRKWSMQPFGG